MKRNCAAALLLFVLTLSSACAFAQPTPSATTSSAASQQQVPDRYSLPPDKLEQATTLYHTELRMFALSTIYSLVILWLLLHFSVGINASVMTPKVEC